MNIEQREEENMTTMKGIHDFTAHLRARGADLIGFAEIDGVSSEKKEALPFGISLGVALNPSIISEIYTGPTHPYYAEYTRANRLL
jgi:hypothetical protein